MIIAKFLLGLVIFVVGLVACCAMFLLICLIGNLCETLVTKLKKHKPLRAIIHTISLLVKVILISLGIGFLILMVYGVGDKFL